MEAKAAFEIGELVAISSQSLGLLTYGMKAILSGTMGCQSSREQVQKHAESLNNVYVTGIYKNKDGYWYSVSDKMGAPDIDFSTSVASVKIIPECSIGAAKLVNATAQQPPFKFKIDDEVRLGTKRSKFIVMRQMVDKKGIMYELKNIKTGNHCIAFESILSFGPGQQTKQVELAVGTAIHIARASGTIAAHAYIRSGVAPGLVPKGLPDIVTIHDIVKLHTKIAYKLRWRDNSGNICYGVVNSDQVYTHGNKSYVAGQDIKCGAHYNRL